MTLGPSAREEQAAGGFLAVISLTGIVLQVFLRKRRRSAFVVAALGALFVIVMIVVTTN